MKIDFKKQLTCYKASRKLEIIEVPKLQYLMIDGFGDPNVSKMYQDALHTLYPVAYKLKFISKNLNKDFVVMPLEGLWWADQMDSFTSARDKSQWHWTMMIMQPSHITPEMLKDAKLKLAQQKDAPPLLDGIRLEYLNESTSVQVLHVGSYDDEADILAKMHHEFIPENKLKMVGKHHEIYLSDPRKVSSEKLKTILRQPVENL